VKSFGEVFDHRSFGGSGGPVKGGGEATDGVRRGGPEAEARARGEWGGAGEEARSDSDIGEGRCGGRCGHALRLPHHRSRYRTVSKRCA
jgi:hypothetical protein